MRSIILRMRSMTSKMMSFAWLLVGLLCCLTAAQSEMTTTTPRTTESTATPCVGQQVLDKVNAMEQELKALGQKTALSPSQYSMAGFESIKDLIEMKNKLFVLEIKLGAAETKLGAAETRLEAAETKLEAAETKLEAAETKLEAAGKKVKDMEPMESKLAVLELKLENTDNALQATQTESRKKGASTFVRWGRKTCFNTTQLVYSGVVGGSNHIHSGGAADALCLTMSPEFDSTPPPARFGYVHGAEYQNIFNHLDHDIPCSVCRTSHPTTLMIPSTHTCPQGWIVQYTGYLGVGHPLHKAPSQYVCLDGEMEHVTGGHLNHNGYLLYLAAYACGSLPCPPYVNNKIVLCVVCSK